MPPTSSNPTGNPEHLPAQVRAATHTAQQLGFQRSCTPQVGRLLHVLAASGHSTAAETGTGCGVGAAWIRSGLPPEARLVTVEHDPRLAAAAASVFAGDPQVQVLCDHWHRLADFAPFFLLFCDNGGKQTEQQRIVDLLQPGGLLVLDDFTPSPTWPPTFAGRRDHLREFWLTHPDLVATEILTTTTSAAIIATKR
jgi:predicted O-methyltransferase YrrM